MENLKTALENNRQVLYNLLLLVCSKLSDEQQDLFLDKIKEIIDREN